MEPPNLGPNLRGGGTDTNGGDITFPALLLPLANKASGSGAKPFECNEVLQRWVPFMTLEGPSAISDRFSNFGAPPRHGLAPRGTRRTGNGSSRGRNNAGGHRVGHDIDGVIGERLYRDR